MATGGSERTYSIWGLVALFALIGIIGLVALIMVASPDGPTTQVAGPATRNTLPGGAASDVTVSSAGSGRDVPDAAATPTSDPATSDAATSTPATSTPASSAPVTVPGGAAAPTGVREVLTSGGATSFTFDVASEFRAEGATTAVAPIRVVAAADGASLNVSIGCGTSSQEVLAQLSLNETTSAITVIAVVLVPAGGAPCDAAAAPREVNIPLSQPLGARAVVVVPAGTPIPQLTPS